MIVKSLEERRVLYAGVPETMHGSSSYRGGIQVKGAGPFDRRMVLDLRSGSQEKSCGVGLRGFESHPPHHTSQIFKQLGFKRESKIRFHGLRLMMVDTRSLKPLASIPNLEVRRKSGEAPVEFVSDKVAETNVSYPEGLGRLTHQFPDAMQSIGELLVLGS